jgi:hypothetical protein
LSLAQTWFAPTTRLPGKSLQGGPVDPVKKWKFLYYQVADILFVFSVFRAFVIILFFFVRCTIRCVTAQVEKYYGNYKKSIVQFQHSMKLYKNGMDDYTEKVTRMSIHAFYASKQARNSSYYPLTLYFKPDKKIL